MGIDEWRGAECKATERRPCLYLDLVLELGAPAVECIDLRNIGLQV